MHSLLQNTRFSKRGLRLVSATVCTRGSCGVLISRAYTEGAPTTKLQKTREARRELVIKFVDEFKATHNGQFPGISLVRKEVGGTYNTLKEIWQELEKEHHAHKNSAGMPELVTTVSKEGRENHDPVNVEVVRNDGELKSTAISIAMEEINLVAKAAYSTSLKRETVDLAGEELEMTGTAISIATEPLDSASKDADSVGVNEFIVEKEGLKQEEKLVTSAFATSKSSVELGVVDQIEPVKAMSEKETMEKNTHLGESLAVASNSLVESSPHPAEADDDSDLAAPEYNDPDHRPSIESSRKKDSRQASQPPPQFGMFLKFLPLSATSKDLIDVFKDCGEISKATVFPLQHEKSKHACGTVIFKTAEGLGAARLKKSVFVRNIEVRLDNGLTKCPEAQDGQVTELKDEPVSADGTTAKHMNNRMVHGSQPITLGDQPEPSPKKLENFDSRNVGVIIPQKSSHGSSNSAPTTLLGLSGMVSKLSAQEVSQGSARNRNPQAEVWVTGVPSQINIFDINEAMAQFGDILNIVQQRGTGLNNYIVWFKHEASASKALREQELKLKDKWCKIGGPTNLLKTVVRISNLSPQVTASKLRNACETIASVGGLEMRRKGTADVEFQARGRAHIDSIVHRLGKLGFGEGKLKVCVAPQIFCANDPDKQFNPQHMQLVRQQRDTLIKQVEQNLEQLTIELQDFRELLALKRAEMFS